MSYWINGTCFLLHNSLYVCMVYVQTNTEKIQTSLPKVIWEEGRVAALSHTYGVKSPLVTITRPNSLPKYAFLWTDPQTALSASSLDTSDLRCQTASGSDSPFCHNALDRPTHARTHVRTYGPTDRPRESLTTIGRCTMRAMRPRNGGYIG